VARNGSGTMSVVYSFTSGTTISSSQMNANLSDIASEITGSLPRDGQASMTGQLKASNGTAASPAMTFGSDPDTGFYRPSANTIGLSVGGSLLVSFSSAGIADASSNLIIAEPTGVMKAYVGTTAPTGYVRANGRTIGNAASSATERANADTSGLFALLWASYSDSVCAVSTGRGASAAADYAANKTIALPDLRGRAMFGLDDMGATAASRLGTVITDETTNGASGGTETHVLTEAELAAHDHAATGLTATADAVAAHQHFVVADVAENGTAVAADNYMAKSRSGGGEYILTGVATAATLGLTSSAGGHTPTVTMGGDTADAGSGTAHSNMPPAFLTTFIIKL
jgi:microcystin-dependent protein